MLLIHIKCDVLAVDISDLDCANRRFLQLTFTNVAKVAQKVTLEQVLTDANDLSDRDCNLQVRHMVGSVIFLINVGGLEEEKSLCWRIQLDCLVLIDRIHNVSWMIFSIYHSLEEYTRSYFNHFQAVCVNFELRKFDLPNITVVLGLKQILSLFAKTEF